MSKEELLKAAGELLQAGTQENFIRVVQENPVLLTEEGIDFFRAMGANIASSGDVESAQMYYGVAEFLTNVRQSLISRIYPSSILIDMVHQIIAEAISIEYAIVRLRSPELKDRFTADELKLLDATIQELIASNNRREAYCAARLNFEAAQILALPVWIKITGQTLLNAIEYSDETAEMRAKVCEITLAAFARDEEPDLRAALMVVWGDALLAVRNIEKAEKIERAIDCYNSALEFITREAFPQQWALVTAKLGFSYRERIRESKSDNIEHAIVLLRESLAVLTPEENSNQWALTLRDLGLAYISRVIGPKEENIESAISCYSEAIRVHAKEAASHNWAVLMNDLGRAYSLLVREDEQDNLDRAIECYESSLQVFTRESHPENWAMLMNNLGLAYRRRSRQEGSFYVERGIDYLREAARLRLELGLRYDARDSLINLSKVLVENERYEDAVDACMAAIRLVEEIRSESLSLDHRAEVLRESVPLFERCIICLARLGRYSEALEIAERGKSRSLIDLFTLHELRPKNAPPEAVQEYERTLFKARALEDRLRREEMVRSIEAESSRPSNAARLAQVRQLHEALSETNRQLQLLVEEIRRQDPDFLFHTDPLSAREMCDLAAESDSTLLLFRVTAQGSFAFLIFPDKTTDVVEVPDVTRDSLRKMIVDSEGDQIAGGWAWLYYQYQIAMESGDNAQAKNAFRVWLDVMDFTLGALYEKLISPIYQRIKNREQNLNRRIDRLVIVPNRDLAILPLHACWRIEDGRRHYLIDDFTIRYASSLSIFKHSLTRERSARNRETIVGVVNPTPPGNLIFSEWECRAIEQLIGDERSLFLWHEKAVKEELFRWVNQSNFLHFSCHGNYRIDAPMQSALFLSNGQLITLGEVLENFDLRHNWLTVLSACETGLVDFREIADEHYGLPVGFLFAGSPTVWSALWTVNDFTTAMMMIRAYEVLMRDGKGKAESLREAQIWLRDIRACEIVELLTRKEKDFGAETSHRIGLTSLRREMKFTCDPDARPFAHPYFWAGLQCAGA